MKFLFFLLLFPLTTIALERDDLLKEEDTDGDKKITVLDKGDRKFLYKGKLILGHYALSNLLQELSLSGVADFKKINENPVDRVSRMIRDEYWKGLTRVIDEKSLPVVLPDSKIDNGGKNFLYIPETDTEALKRFPLALKLPKIVKNHGLLYLPEPYVVPGGRFNEMYGWDSYFESIGLMIDGRDDLVVSMIKNFSYQIMNYGKILNANRTYYLFRSQPPFFTSMIRLPLKGNKKPDWLDSAVTSAIREYETVWMSPDRLTATGLSRYHGKGHGIPPEVEPGHYHPVISPFAKKAGLKIADYQKKYETGEIREPELDIFFEHDACVRESGHDTTYRFCMNGKESCADFVTVDLNTLLYKTELDLAWLIKKYYSGVFDGRSSVSFLEKAAKRKELMMKYFWDEKLGFFFDYHVPSGKRSKYISATGFYPLFANESKILTNQQAERVKSFGLKHLEGPGGIFSTAKVSLVATGDSHERQWEWPNGWAPHQIIIWEGLRNYGFQADAERLVSKWLLMIAENARDYNGTIPEKFDVEKRSHAVFAEYGNVGTEFSYITREGFGWMNASFQYGLSLLSPRSKEELRRKSISQ